MTGTVSGRVTGTVSGTQESEFALPHPLPLPHIPTPSTSSVIMALRAIHPIDAMAVTLATIRPDWSPTHIRAVLARSNGSTRDLARRALTLALDPDVRTPNGIENADMRRYEPTPVLPTVAEALAPTLCAHEFRVGGCPMCRKDAK